MAPEETRERGGGAVTEVGILIQGYSTHLRAVLGKAENTVIAYTGAVNKWAAWWKRPAEFFREEEWDDWTAHLHDSGLSRTTINLHHVAVKRFFKYLRRRKLLQHDPSALNETLKTPKKLPVWLTEQEVDAVISGASRLRDRAILETLYSCGLRATECRTLTLDKLRGDFIEVDGKGLKQRVVPIPARAKATLEAWLKERPADTSYVFPNNWRRPFAAGSFSRFIGKLAKLSGINKTVGPHTFRHSIATHLAIRGVQPDKIQRFLGHENIVTTMIYIHLAESLVQGAILKAHPHA